MVSLQKKSPPADNADGGGSKSKDHLPLVINTWNVTEAANGAWHALTEDGYDSVDALVHGCSLCEDGSCMQSIGMGGSPDENGETTQDAMIMDGRTMNVGSVGCLRNIEHAIKVAHAVMKYTKHTLLVGDQATEFALSMGFTKKSLTTNSSWEMWEDWKNNSCQPNFWQNVTPDPTTDCGPYSPNKSMYRDDLKLSHNKEQLAGYSSHVNKECHDTIGMVVIDEHENIAAGTTTNGACHKIPGRVGDSPIVGAGAYALNGIGGAAATGDGDIMMRFVPSFHAVQLMSQGDDPTTAAQKAISLINSFFPNVSAGLIAVNIHGEHGGACVGMETFQYNFVDDSSSAIVTIPVECEH